MIFSRACALVRVAFVLPGMVGAFEAVAQKSSAADDAPNTEASSQTMVMNDAEQGTIRTLRRFLYRAANLEEGQQRRAGLARAVDVLSSRIESADTSPQLATELLILRAKAELALADVGSAEQTAAGLFGVQRNRLGANGFDTWLSDRVDRLRNTRDFDVAILLLRHAVDAQPDTVIAGGRSLLIGDLLVQKAYPDGPYDAAIEHYARTAERYRARWPYLADDAELRQAKTLWRNNQAGEAKELFAKLAGAANEPVAEEARHYPQLMEEMSSSSPPARP